MDPMKSVMSVRGRPEAKAVGLREQSPSGYRFTGFERIGHDFCGVSGATFSSMPSVVPSAWCFRWFLT